MIKQNKYKDDLVEEIPPVEEGHTTTGKKHQSHDSVANQEPISCTNLMTREFKHSIRHLNTFMYGKIGLFEHFLLQVFGKNWKTGRWSELIREEKQLSNLSTTKKALILIPAVQNEDGFNRLVAKAMSLGRPVWLIGYPSTIHKHLWANFSCFILSPAPKVELEILRDVLGLTTTDLNILSLESRAPGKNLIVTPDKTQYIKGTCTNQSYKYQKQKKETSPIPP